LGTYHKTLPKQCGETKTTTTCILRWPSNQWASNTNLYN